MTRGNWFRAAAPLALVLSTPMAGAEMNPHIPPAPDPALTRAMSARDYDGFEIRIAPVVSIPVAVPEMLRNACRTHKDIWACTFFAAEKLQCRCVRKKDNWHLDATAEFVPVMYLRNERFRQHELQHIDHVAGMLRNFLRQLVGRTFATEAECAAAATRASTDFSSVMNGFRRKSNLQLR